MAEFWTSTLWPLIIMIAQSVLLLVVLLIAIAYILLADRKIWAAVQIRRGPNVVGPWGLFQSFADLLKFVLKEPIIPAGANKGVFLLAPLVSCVLALTAWAVIPTNLGWVIADINVGVLFIFAISSLSIYGIIMAGWSSNSKYAFLGAMRSAAQMVSYEVSMGFVIVSVLAETNRSPFDLPEGESELVAGFFVEYSAMSFALFYLGEYGSMILMSAMTSILFLGGWLAPFNWAPFTGVPGHLWAGFWFALKVAIVLFCFLWVRATVPRFRYDQLMRLGWKVFLPLSLFWLVLTAGVLVATGWLPK